MKSQAAAPTLPLEHRFLPYWELTKPRITSMVLLTTAAGFYLGSVGSVRWGLLLAAILGTMLVAAGTAVLNQYLERDNDGRMRRTAQRPLPSGRLGAPAALAFGSACCAGGVLYLALSTNLLTSLLAGATALVYLAVYTPLKTRTVWCTTVGALPGAAPPLIGWAAARGSLDAGAWVLFAILFLWQYPHFLAIAWVYREDYRLGGFKMLPLADPEGRRTAAQVLVFGLLLWVITLTAYPAGLAGGWYLAGAALLGAGFLWTCLHLARGRGREDARVVLRTSVLYLPLLLLLLVVDKA